MMRLPSLSKWKSEMPGQSRHTLPDSYRRLVPRRDLCTCGNLLRQPRAFEQFDIASLRRHAPIVCRIYLLLKEHFSLAEPDLRAPPAKISRIWANFSALAVKEMANPSGVLSVRMRVRSPASSTLNISSG